MKLYEDRKVESDGVALKLPTIVAMTADNSDKNRELWLKEGVHYFMPKPCDITQLKLVLETALNHPVE